MRIQPCHGKSKPARDWCSCPRDRSGASLSSSPCIPRAGGAQGHPQERGCMWGAVRGVRGVHGVPRLCLLQGHPVLSRGFPGAGGFVAQSILCCSVSVVEEECKDNLCRGYSTALIREPAEMQVCGERRRPVKSIISTFHSNDHFPSVPKTLCRECA